MMDQSDFRKIVEHAFRFGHHLNPAYPELRDLTVEDAVELTPNHRLSKFLVASVQASDANLESIAQAIHQRALIIDGDPGPATLRLVDVPRCECPDFGLATIEGTGTGSWPHSCLPEFANVHAIIMALEKSRMQAAWLNNLDAILGAITKAQNAVGQHPVWIFDLSQFAHMKINWGSIGGSTIGFNSVPSSFSCTRTITGKIDTTWSPSDIKLLGRLGMHEWFGHGNGYGHTSGGIMNPSILSGEVSWSGDKLEDDMKRNFGGPITVGGLGDWGYSQW